MSSIFPVNGSATRSAKAPWESSPIRCLMPRAKAPLTVAMRKMLLGSSDGWAAAKARISSNIFSSTVRVLAGQIIHVHGQQILTQHTMTLDVLHRRPEPAVGHVTLAAPKPLKHFATTASEHLELQGRFGNVRAQAPAAAAGHFPAQPQQLRQGGVG